MMKLNDAEAKIILNEWAYLLQDRSGFDRFGENEICSISSQWGSNTNVRIVRSGGSWKVQISGLWERISERLESTGLSGLVPIKNLEEVEMEGTPQDGGDGEGGGDRWFIEFKTGLDPIEFYNLEKEAEVLREIKAHLGAPFEKIQNLLGSLPQYAGYNDNSGLIIEPHQCADCGNEARYQCWYRDKNGTVEVDGKTYKFHITCKDVVQTASIKQV